MISVILPDGVESWHDCYEIRHDEDLGHDRAFLLYDIYIRGLFCPKGMGFEASIPKGVPQLVIGSPVDREFLLGACYHDRRYELQKGSRKEADDICWELWIEEGVSEFKADWMRMAVRTHGHLVWEDEADKAAKAVQRAYETAIDEGLSV